MSAADRVVKSHRRIGVDSKLQSARVTFLPKIVASSYAYEYVTNKSSVCRPSILDL